MHMQLHVHESSPAAHGHPPLFTCGIPAAGHLYHIRWSQDADTGELRLRDYWRDPLSGQHISAAAAEAAAPSSSSG